MPTPRFHISLPPLDLRPPRKDRKYYLLALTLIVGMFATVLALLGKLPSKIPLFFTLPWGEARLAPKLELLLVPTMGAVTMLVNLIVSRLIKNDQVLAQTLSAATLFVAIMLVVALYGILQSII